jgi:transcriptional regulator with XRE-family HTH domain
MIVGDRIRAIREEKKFSQGDIESRTGLLRCYVSRVENGHTVPSVETLEKFARALETPLYRLFYEGQNDSKPPKLLNHKPSDVISWGSKGKDARTFHRLRSLLGKMEESDRRLLLYMAQKLGSRPVSEERRSK